MALAPRSPSIPRKSDRTKPPANGSCNGSGAGGAGGSGGAGGGNPAEYSDRVNMSSAEDMYDCLTNTVGLSHNQALGVLANVNRESGFNAAAVGDNGNSFGLFQFNRPAGRADPFLSAVPDWQTNPCGQAQYMFGSDSLGRQYANTQFDNPLDAANYFTSEVERPSATNSYVAPGGYNSQIINDLITQFPNP